MVVGIALWPMKRRPSQKVMGDILSVTKSESHPTDTMQQPFCCGARLLILILMGDVFTFKFVPYPMANNR